MDKTIYLILLICAISAGNAFSPGDCTYNHRKYLKASNFPWCPNDQCDMPFHELFPINITFAANMNATRLHHIAFIDYHHNGYFIKNQIKRQNLDIDGSDAKDFIVNYETGKPEWPLIEGKWYIYHNTLNITAGGVTRGNNRLTFMLECDDKKKMLCLAMYVNMH